jgi:hypothetical protein
MKRYKDTAILCKNTRFKDCNGKSSVAKKGSLVTIEGLNPDCTYKLMITDPVPSQKSEISYCNVISRFLNITPGDVNRDFTMPTLIMNGFPEELLTKQ